MNKSIRARKAWKVYQETKKLICEERKMNMSDNQKREILWDKHKKIENKLANTRGMIQNPLDLLAQLPEDEYQDMVNIFYDEVDSVMRELEQWRDDVMIEVEKKRGEIHETN